MDNFGIDLSVRKIRCSINVLIVEHNIDLCN